jgi:hypothetical protein
MRKSVEGLKRSFVPKMSGSGRNVTVVPRRLIAPIFLSLPWGTPRE